MLKMYIAVLDQVPDHMVPVLVAHATLGAHLKWSQESSLSYDEWLKDSFRKCVLKVNAKEFAKIVDLPWVYQAHENSTLGGVTSCVVVCPRPFYPNVIKFAKLWAPVEIQS